MLQKEDKQYMNLRIFDCEGLEFFQSHMKNIFVVEIYNHYSEVYSEPYKTSEVEIFAKVIKDFHW